MDNAAARFAAEIRRTIDLGRDLYVLDHYIVGPDCLEQARKVLARDACADPERAAFLAAILHGLEDGAES